MATLITGSGGFLGSAVTKEISGTKYVPSSLMLNLINQREVDDYFIGRDIDTVIHCAGLVGGMPFNMANPGRIGYENMMMSLNLLEASRKHGVKKYVNIGTICGYPDVTPVPFQEKYIGTGKPHHSNYIYGVCKNYVADLCSAYKKQYGLDVVNLYPVNMAGWGDDFSPESSHVIPALITKFSEAVRYDLSEVRLLGDGSASREFLSVRDAARAVRMSLNWNDCTPINLGTGISIKISELAKKIVHRTGFEGILKWGKSDLNGQEERCLDTSKAEKLGFKAEITFDEMLDDEFAYYNTLESIN